MQLMQFIQSCGNPQQAVLSILEEQAQENPRYGDIVSCAKSNDSRGVENAVRAYLAQQGVDFDKEFNAFKKNWGFK